MKKTYVIFSLLFCFILLTACGGEETLGDQPMSTTTTSNTTAVIEVHSVSKLTEHLKENGVVWDREEDGELNVVLAGAKAGTRLYNGEHYIDIYMFDMDDESTEDIITRIQEHRELERNGEVMDVEWREPFAVYVDDANQRQQVLDALRSY